MSTLTQQIQKRFSLRGSWWITTLFAAFALAAAFGLLNLIVNGQCNDANCITAILTQSLRYATPIAFAALTGVLCERSGIVNIGIEGQMLMAAMVGYAVNLFLLFRQFHTILMFTGKINGLKKILPV